MTAVRDTVDVRVRVLPGNWHGACNEEEGWVTNSPYSTRPRPETVGTEGSQDTTIFDIRGE